MQAIILAAGMGKRLKELTRNNTKCMVKVNGETLIERMLRQLDEKQLSRIVMVIGYEGQRLKTYVQTLTLSTEIVFVNNSVYETTNNIYSLSLAKDYLVREDTLLFESDVIFEDCILDDLLKDPRETVALVDKYESWMDGTCVKLDKEDRIVEFISGRTFDFHQSSGCYKTVNIYKFSKHFSETHYVPFLEAYLKALGTNEYYEQVLRVITMLDDSEIRAKRLSGQKWYEIDDAQDLDIASVLFCKDRDQQVKLIVNRYGGYWRFPKLKDFCYLVNPYYPPQKMKDEITASFDTLLVQYPSGMKVNAMLAAKNFGVREDQIVVGNGAAELIKLLMEKGIGKTGVIKPTFEEYPNRLTPDEIESFYPEKDGFRYTADDVMTYFSDKEIKSLILINPDNPSGNYIPRKDLERLMEWSRKKQIVLIVDESFADFADEQDNSLLQSNLLEENPQLIVVKSISKSYGVPGLRLGILASGNKTLVESMKKETAIWNINSFAEFFLQIQGKYSKDYERALQEFRQERRRYAEGLDGIQGIKVYPSQANYFMVELPKGISVKSLISELLNHHRILIKDLAEKTNGQGFIRVAVRGRRDNDCLITALRCCVNKGMVGHFCQ